VFVGRSGIHPLENVDQLNPRPGLRSWVLTNSATSERSKWRESEASIHDDGSITIAGALGGHRTTNGQSTGDTVAVSALESAVADLMGLVRKASSHIASNDYDVQLGVEWAGEGPMTFEAQMGGTPTSVPLSLRTGPFPPQSRPTPARTTTTTPSTTPSTTSSAMP